MRLAVTVIATMAAPRAVARLVGELADKAFGAERRDDVEVAVHEVVANAVEHGPPDHPISVAATAGHGALDVEVVDAGAGGIPDDLDVDRDDAVDGRGLLIAQAYCDELTWRQTDEGHVVHLAFRTGPIADLGDPAHEHR
jgi:anti-sigma regulatory factor (Ser/Thr protein kinase)